MEVSDNRVVVDIKSNEESDIAAFLELLRDLGFVFYRMPRSPEAVSFILRFQDKGLVSGEFLELKNTPSGRWWTKPIEKW